MLRKSNTGTATTKEAALTRPGLSLPSVTTAADSADRGRSLPQPFQVLELRVPGEHLLVEPAVDDAFSKPPLFAELRRGDAVPLGPLVDRLRLEAEVGGQVFDREDFLLGGNAVRRRGRGHDLRLGGWSAERTGQILFVQVCATSFRDLILPVGHRRNSRGACGGP